MPPELHPFPASPPRAGTSGRFGTPASGLVVLAACLATGCSTFPEGLGGGSPPVVDKAAASNAMLNEYLQMMQRLAKGSPSEKAEIAAAANKDYGAAKTPNNALRLALVLATPNHPATDRVRAQMMLQELRASPEALLPGEQALVQVEMVQIDDYLKLENDKQKLVDDATARAKDLAASNQKLKTETEQQRKELEQAKAKLEEITKIETKPLTERTHPERTDRKPPNSSEGQPQ